MKNAERQHLPALFVCSHLKVDFVTCHQKYQEAEQQQSASGQGQSQQGAGMEEKEEGLANLNGQQLFRQHVYAVVDAKQLGARLAWTPRKHHLKWWFPAHPLPLPVPVAVAVPIPVPVSIAINSPLEDHQPHYAGAEQNQQTAVEVNTQHAIWFAGVLKNRVVKARLRYALCSYICLLCSGTIGICFLFLI